MTARRLIAPAVFVWALAFGWSLRAVELPGALPAGQPPPTGAAPSAAPSNADCLACHEDDAAVRADGRPVVVKPAVFEGSVHGALSCVDCHADLAAGAGFPHPEKLARADCSTCHPDPVEKFRQGVHATARERGVATTPACADCHGSHDILPSSNPQSRTYHLNIAATCSKCHGDAAIAAGAGLPADIAASFADSIHGQALSRSGLTVAPTCSDCHGAHDIFDPKDPKSRVAQPNVPATCGRCHEGIAQKFSAGIHGAVLAGGGGAPACQTCHTAHAIRRSETTAWQLSVIGQCGTCHADRLATFKDTFHGQVTNLGFRSVAGCADCHGAHEILPASDPRSPIAPGNLVQTCRRCHENANENFVKYDPHADKHDRSRNPILYFVAKFMTVLLTGVFGFFGIHTALWFSAELRERRRGKAKP
ncbi:MAG TPA: cytochrome c3 family protein [Vicinamibacterales bacterium]|nr:cytochrome c3 family protein [Vicinamibacterales bacterium]